MVDLDKIVSLCKRRGFIIGQVGSTDVWAKGRLWGLAGCFWKILRRFHDVSKIR